MAKPHKYMFDLDFDPPVPHAPKAKEPAHVEEPAEPALPPSPTFTEDELQVARDAAYEQGRQAGIAEAAASTERSLAEAMVALSNRVAELRAAEQQSAEGNLRTAVRVSMAVLKKMLPAACEAHAFGEVTHVVEECVGHILDEPRIIVRVSPALVEPVRERLEAVAVDQGFEGRVVVQAHQGLPPGDARVEWTDGGAERDQARLMRDIDEAVERSLAPPEYRAADG